MTTNYNIMNKSNQYIQMDPIKKFKIKLSDNKKIAYINNYFLELTQFKIHELILKDLQAIMHPDMPKFYLKFMEQQMEISDINYFIIKGLIKGGDYYYSLLKINTNTNQQGEISHFLIEGKMLPASAIEKTGEMMHIHNEIEKNAGIDAAFKYFEGLLEEKGLSYNEFIYALVGVNEKTIKKYFELGDEPKKKKKSWF